MKILLTGASGFLGGHLVPRLMSEGHDVGIVVRRRDSSWRSVEGGEAAITIVGDLARPDSYANSFSSFAPEAIVHLAWWGVRNSYRDDPGQLINLNNTLALIEQAVHSGTRHFIGIGSQAEYGPSESVINEDAPTRPSTVYGATKLATCLLARHLCRLAGIRFAWLRIFSLYGPADDASWLIPSITLSLMRGERPALTSGEQLWDFVHVDDAAAAICAVVSTHTATGVFNVGSGTSATIRSIVERLRDLVSPGAPLSFGELPYRPDQVMHLEADVSRLTLATGWTPRISLLDGLQQTVRWYQDNQDLYDSPRELSVESQSPRSCGHSDEG